jgi:hypothetical protein
MMPGGNSTATKKKWPARIENEAIRYKYVVGSLTFPFSTRNGA